MSKFEVHNDEGSSSSTSLLIDDVAPGICNRSLDACEVSWSLPGYQLTNCFYNQRFATAGESFNRVLITKLQIVDVQCRFFRRVASVCPLAAVITMGSLNTWIVYFSTHVSTFSFIT